MTKSRRNSVQDILGGSEEFEEILGRVTVMCRNVVENQVQLRVVTAQRDVVVPALKNARDEISHLLILIHIKESENEK